MQMHVTFVLGIIICTILVLSVPVSFEQNYNIPSWVKNNAKWWSQGLVGDSDFTKGIQYLVQTKIINIPPQNQTASTATAIPSWVKNIAAMWTSGKVSDDDFLKGVEYLVRIGVIHVQILQNTSPVSNVPTPPASNQEENTQPKINATNPANSNPPGPPVIVPPPSNLTVSHVTNIPPANATLYNQTTPSTQTQNPATFANPQNTDSLIGTGVNLTIKGNLASGTMSLAGVTYDAPSLIVTRIGTQIQLQGSLQTSETLVFQAVGVPSNANQYNFYGTISNNGRSGPVQFSAALVQASNQTASQPVTTASKTVTSKTMITSSPTKPQAPALPMLLLYAQSQQVVMGYQYSLAIKTFDPKANPDKTFDQFYGGIPDVIVNGTILDQNNQKFSGFLAKTDKNGLYQYQVLIPYYKGWAQNFKVNLNVTKTGYVPQYSTFSFVAMYPNQGGAAAVCTATTPSAPTGPSATAISSTEVDLSWTGSAGATAYHILRGIIHGGPYSEINESPTASYADTTVAHGTTYYYVIQAANCAGTSGNSTETSATP